MPEDVYVTSLRRAAEIHGSTQALASALRVPESTLRRWMSGRAMMPMQAFNRVIDAILEHEAAHPASPPAPSGEKRSLSFRIEDLFARCGKCDGTGFVADTPPRLTDPLACLACGEQFVHRDLLLELAERQAARRRAQAAARKRPATRPVLAT